MREKDERGFAVNLFREHIARKVRSWRKAVGREEAHKIIKASLKDSAKEKNRKWRFSFPGYKAKIESRVEKMRYSKMIRQEMARKQPIVSAYLENARLMSLMFAQIACLIEQRNAAKETV